MEHTTYTHNGYSVEISWKYPGITTITVSTADCENILSQSFETRENPLHKAVAANSLVAHLSAFEEETCE